MNTILATIFPFLGSCRRLAFFAFPLLEKLGVNCVLFKNVSGFFRCFTSSHCGLRLVMHGRLFKVALVVEHLRLNGLLVTWLSITESIIGLYMILVEGALVWNVIVESFRVH